MGKKAKPENKWKFIWFIYFKMSQKNIPSKGVMAMISGGLILNVQYHQQKVIPWLTTGGTFHNLSSKCG